MFERKILNDLLNLFLLKKKRNIIHERRNIHIFGNDSALNFLFFL